MRWAGHVECKGQILNAYRIFIGKPEGKRPLGRLDVDGKTVIEWILEKEGENVWAGDMGQWQAL
jgi:hypothetical protein